MTTPRHLIDTDLLAAARAVLALLDDGLIVEASPTPESLTRCSVAFDELQTAVAEHEQLLATILQTERRHRGELTH